jgi:hypothetical protein
MQNADKSSSGRTRLLKGTVAIQRNSQDILAPPTPYSYKGAGSRVSVAIGGSSDCCIGGGGPQPPSAPSIMNVTPGNGELVVEFDTARSVVYPYWTVSTTSSVGGEIVPDVTGITSPITVDGLVNGRAYTLRLTKTTEAGTSAPSAPFTATPATVPDTPANILVTTVTATSATFTFTQNNGGSPITGYKYSLDNGAYTSLLTTSSPLTITTGLITGQTSYVRLKATNIYGDSAASDPYVVTPVGSGSPVVTLLNTLGFAKWNPPTGVSSVNYLVVGGGGGGGGSYDNGAGGGGGGGLALSGLNYSVSSATTYVMTVGDGGAGGTGTAGVGDTDGQNGSDSIFGTFTAKGGIGGGSSRNDRTGSGGAVGNVLTLTAPVGGKGGRPTGATFPLISNVNGGGGGGGMLTAGVTAISSSIPAAGGNGIVDSITAAIYAAGGSGGLRNGSNTVGVNGMPNTGNGGGGSNSIPSSGRAGGKGGSGVIVIGYTMP